MIVYPLPATPPTLRKNENTPAKELPETAVLQRTLSFKEPVQNTSTALTLRNIATLEDMQRTAAVRALEDLQRNAAPSLPPLFRPIFLLRQIVHFALKGYAHPDTQFLQTTYSSSFAQHRSYIKAKASYDLIQESLQSPAQSSTKDMTDLARMHKHRMNYLAYDQMFPFMEEGFSPDNQGRAQAERIVNFIIFNIEELENPHSPFIVVLEDGSRFFAGPGGFDFHYFSWGILRDPNGNYQFLLFNRGALCSDPKLHGQIEFPKGHKNYSKTRTCISVPNREILKNRDLLLLLVQGRATVYSCFTDKPIIDGQEVYQTIYKVLVQEGGGTVLKSAAEIQVEPLQMLVLCPLLPEDDKTKIGNFMYKSLKRDLNFNSKQLYGTCGVSNHDLMDKMLGPKNTQRTLKHRVIKTIRDQTAWVTDHFQTKSATEAIEGLRRAITTEELAIDPFKHLLARNLLNQMEDCLADYGPEKEQLMQVKELDQDPTKLEEHTKKFQEIKEGVLQQRQETVHSLTTAFEALEQEVQKIEDLSKRQSLSKKIKTCSKMIAFNSNLSIRIFNSLCEELISSQQSLPEGNNVPSLLSQIQESLNLLQFFAPTLRKLDEELSVEFTLKKLQAQKSRREIDLFSIKMFELQNCLKDQLHLQSLTHELAFHLAQEFEHPSTLFHHTDLRLKALQDKIAAAPSESESEEVTGEEIERFLKELIESTHLKNNETFDREYCLFAMEKEKTRMEKYLIAAQYMPHPALAKKLRQLLQNYCEQIIASIEKRIETDTSPELKNLLTLYRKLMQEINPMMQPD